MKRNIMKKLYFLLFLIVGIANAQIINIPDANFKAKLLEASVNLPIANSVYPEVTGTRIKIDTNDDGEIQVSETLNVQYLRINTADISDLTGIEHFTNLKALVCGGNNLTNVSMLNSLTDLIYLNCANNYITTMNLSLPNLNELIFTSNQVTSLDISGLPTLTKILCLYNNLTSITSSPGNILAELNFTYSDLTTFDASQFPHLTKLDCQGNQLTALDVSMLPNLTELRCSGNPLTTLNLGTSSPVIILYCGLVNLTTLDLSNLTNLSYLSCTNNPNLTWLNIKNGKIESTLQFSANPNLQFICADLAQVSTIQTQLTSLGMNTTICNSYCSFTPGGNYNTITGAMIFDADNNGCDTNDAPQPNIKLDINDGTNFGATFTNNLGNYNFYTPIGNYMLAPDVENPSFFNFVPPTASINFTNNSNNTTTQNFCISPNGVHNDLEVIIAPITPARPGFNAVYQIVFKNKGNQTLSGNVTLNYNDLILDFINSTLTPNVQSSGQLTYNYTNLMPFENRNFYVTLNVNSPTETPAVNIGDILNFGVTINPIIGDDFPDDNQFNYNQTVVGSFDPNDKTCLEGVQVSPAKIGDFLHYNINFENTGTAPATFIVVKDIIDTAKFDISTLQVLNSSHPMTVRINGNKVEFFFENINLGAGQHGNVVFKIKTKNTLVTGNTVTNKADIYFDYNAPVITNIASTTFQALSTGEFELDNSISVAPNPTNSIIDIRSNTTIKSIELFDIHGRVLQTNLVNENETTINISDKSNGVYFLKITSDKGVKVEKIIKE